MNQKLQNINKFPYVTVFLIVVNVILFLMCTFNGNLLYNIGDLSLHSFFDLKEYYRILTSMFLHADINHIVNNMLLLGGIGVMLENEMNHNRFVLIYFLSGLGGQVVSLIYKMNSGQWYVSSIGASGAVFGLVGVLLAMSVCWERKLKTVTWQRIVIVIAYTIYSGIRSANIDNAAHIGGCLCGFVLGLLMCLIVRMQSRRKGEQ